ncbi:MAG: sugar ABC transporter permease [Anaerolineae bacterium]|nr:sugar ABC transporter permease [Anaerolineae bacterium]
MVGMRNFERLFRDKDFHTSLANNVRWLAVFITVPTAMGLGLAMIFNAEMRGGRWFKVSFYSPLVLSLAVIGLIWGWVYNPSQGLLELLPARHRRHRPARLACRPPVGDLVHHCRRCVAAGGVRDDSLPGRPEERGPDSDRGQRGWMARRAGSSSGAWSSRCLRP